MGGNITKDGIAKNPVELGIPATVELPNGDVLKRQSINDFEDSTEFSWTERLNGGSIARNTTQPYEGSYSYTFSAGNDTETLATEDSAFTDAPTQMAAIFRCYYAGDSGDWVAFSTFGRVQDDGNYYTLFYAPGGPDWTLCYVSSSSPSAADEQISSNVTLDLNTYEYLRVKYWEASGKFKAQADYWTGSEWKAAHAVATDSGNRFSGGGGLGCGQAGNTARNGTSRGYGAQATNHFDVVEIYY